MKGPKRSGKGTIGHVLKALVGMNNVAAPSLGGLNGNFALQPLLDKPVALIGDARAGTQANMQAAVEKLLGISGGDAITVDRKHKEPITIHLPTRFVITTNELPRLGDTSGAMASRFIVLTMTESFDGKEDHGLKDRLVAEAPGILRWALEGLDRLRERGRFVQPKSGLEDYRELAALNNPMSEFV
jgi:phage/plasmid-associated DNA primase